MPFDLSKSLRDLRTRRIGADGGQLTTDSLRAFADSSGLTKSVVASAGAYETRTGAAAAKYVLGAMEKVDARYTKTSFDEGERVFDRIKEGLAGTKYEILLDFQGSVPLDVHIRGASDIDILVLDKRYITVDSAGPGKYTDLAGLGPTIDELRGLRQQCEGILTRRFFGATVDITGAKSIALSGGAFQRKVDVVPSFRHDTIDYQIHREKHYREIRVLDKHKSELIPNSPFLHMKKINDHDLVNSGGTKKAIRLLKNVKEDSGLASAIELSSYDIASLMWHCPAHELIHSNSFELSILEVISGHLRNLIANPSIAAKLKTPNNFQFIFDSPQKTVGLILLSSGLEELKKIVEDDLNASNSLYPTMRKTLKEMRIG